MSAQKYSTHIEKAFKLSNKKILISNKKKYYKNSQIFEDFYHDAGQFYWGTPRAWNSKKLINNKSTIYELEKHQAVDINTLDDWKFAEKLFKLKI